MTEMSDKNCRVVCDLALLNISKHKISVLEMGNLGAKRHPVTINIPLFFANFWDHFPLFFHKMKINISLE